MFNSSHFYCFYSSFCILFKNQNITTLLTASSGDWNLATICYNCVISWTVVVTGLYYVFLMRHHINCANKYFSSWSYNMVKSDKWRYYCCGVILRHSVAAHCCFRCIFNFLVWSQFCQTEMDSSMVKMFLCVLCLTFVAHLIQGEW
jgi:hypothetical protein